MDYSINASPANLDWVQIWREMHDLERQQGDDFTHPDFHIGNDYYHTAASRFVRFTQQIQQPDDFMQWLLPKLTQGDTILDIGAGSGRYLTTLTEAECKIIALEPSQAMISFMQKEIENNKLYNVTVVHDYWPSSNIITCDVAICVQVIDAVRNIDTFIAAMNSATRKLCVILLGVRHPTTPLLPLWHKFHGTPRLPIPGAYECINVLAQMGIMSNLTVFSIPQTFISFPNYDDAVAETCFRLRIPHDSKHMALISDLILAHCIMHEDGRVIVPYDAPPTAVIWWNPMKNVLSRMQ